MQRSEATYAISPDIQSVYRRLLSSIESSGRVGGISDEGINGMGHLTESERI